MSEWLMEEGALDPEVALVGATGTRFRGPSGSITGATSEQNLAVFLKPLVVLNTRKLFGEADIRVDALVSHGGPNGTTLFHPQTIRFPRVVDGEDMAENDNGLLVYYGKPSHFLVMSVTLSRDTKDSDDLTQLITEQAKSDEVSSLLQQLAAAASPHVAAVQVAMQAALTLGNVAYKLVRQISPKTLGLYRANWLAHMDGFGVGRHPETGVARAKDFEFAYEIVADSQ